VKAGVRCLGIAAPQLVPAMAAVLVLCLGITQTHAHKANVFAYVEGDRLIVEGYFSASVKAQDCPVEVLDERGRKIHEGKTDHKGIYSFKLTELPPYSGGLRIVLGAGMGHKAEYSLSASDLPGSVSPGVPSPALQPATKTEAQPVADVASSASDTDEAVLGAVLDKKLDPIIRMLGKHERLLLEQKHGGPSMTEVIGGIGWIMGLVGIAFYFWGRGRSSTRRSDRQRSSEGGSV
jgi:nickel transport protein